MAIPEANDIYHVACRWEGGIGAGKEIHTSTAISQFAPLTTQYQP